MAEVSVSIMPQHAVQTSIVEIEFVDSKGRKVKSQNWVAECVTCGWTTGTHFRVKKAAEQIAREHAEDLGDVGVVLVMLTPTRAQADAGEP
jgi:hypothetical protein